jgi:hypothetical protein
MRLGAVANTPRVDIVAMRRMAKIPDIRANELGPLCHRAPRGFRERNGNV